ncbi:MAG TPA: hypothetical protein VHP11_17815 [Tepidisphaeraceae bacterium]|nr:hypothetical protein [Tepidisphaeraceae bacterium]
MSGGARYWVSVGCVSLALASSVQASIIAPDGRAPDGRTYGQLAAEWWQWAISIPRLENPLTDSIGENTYTNQHGPVFFLAPSMGSSYTRKVTLAQGQYLFFPVLTSIVFNLPEENYTEAEMRQQLDEFNSTASLLYASVDDQVRNIWIYRNASPAGGFQVTVPEDNIFDSPDNGFDLPGGTYGPAVTDGWWLLVEPLAPGQHKIHFKGGTGDNDLIQVTTYNITVIPEPGSLALLSLPALLLRRRTVLGQSV